MYPALLPVLLLGCHKEEEQEAPAPDATLTLMSPAAGDWLDEGDVEVKGTATQVSAVVVNGQQAQLSGGSFSAQVTLEHGVNVVEALATELNGDTLFVRHGVLAGTFADPGGAVEQAMVLRVNQGGLDTIMDYATGLMSAEELNKTAMSMNPIYEDTYDVWGYDAAVISADVESIDFGQVSLTATPTPGVLEIRATIPDLDVWVRAYGEAIGIDFDVDVQVTASEAEVVAQMSASADGGIHVELLSAEIDIRDFAYDTSLLPWGIEEYLLVDTIRDYLEDTIISMIEEQVPALLDDTLSGLDPSFETELMGSTVSLAAEFASLEIDNDGLIASLDLDVSLPSDGSQSYKGYLSAGPASTNVDTTADMAATVSDDLLNRALFEAWQAGLLNMTLSTTDGSLEPALLIPLKATQGTISVQASLPPVVVERDGKLQAQVGELIIDILTPDGQLGTSICVAATAFVDLDLVVEDNLLLLDLGEVDLNLMVRNSDWGADNDTVTTLIDEMLPLDSMLLLLGSLSFELPALEGFAVRSADVEREGTGVGIRVDLE